MKQIINTPISEILKMDQSQVLEYHDLLPEWFPKINELFFRGYIMEKNGKFKDYTSIVLKNKENRIFAYYEKDSYFIEIKPDMHDAIKEYISPETLGILDIVFLGKILSFMLMLKKQRIPRFSRYI